MWGVTSESPLWLKVPIYKKYRKSALKKRARVAVDAYEIALSEGWEAALCFLENRAVGNYRNAIHIFRANVAKSDEEWTREINAYLAKNQQACAVKLAPGSNGRFYRLEPACDPEAISDGPKVSVIMAAFNAEATLGFAARSILNQSVRNLELIIVDDASSDTTFEVARRLAATDARVKVLRNATNVGPYVSKNLALKVATGEFVTGHDADDWALPNRIELDLMDLQSSNGGISAIQSSMVRLKEDGTCSYFSRHNILPDGVLRPSCISVMMKRDFLLEKLGSWDCVRFGADSELIGRAKVVMGDRYACTTRVGMLCLDAPTSLTNHPKYGIDRIGGVSNTRKEYQQSWVRWHATLTSNDHRLPFPHTERRFDAPTAMRVPHEDIEKCMVQDD